MTQVVISLPSVVGTRTFSIIGASIWPRISLLTSVSAVATLSVTENISLG